ncbi:MAG TPA: hypothetical protein VGQ73_02340 [Gemmatimonadales bacterium]|nr:hypothetical protein [Gemmatimonadales bacterium]
MPRKSGRLQPCDDAQARARLRDAQAQLDLAQLADANSNAEERKAAASCVVLAGIAPPMPPAAPPWANAAGAKTTGMPRSRCDGSSPVETRRQGTSAA